MKWHRIAIRSHDSAIAQTSATRLIERILEAIRGANTPEGFQVWQRRYTPVDYEYYLSPIASEILVPLLSGYRPTPCEDPDLRTLKQVLL